MPGSGRIGCSTVKFSGLASPMHSLLDGKSPGREAAQPAGRRQLEDARQPGGQPRPAGGDRRGSSTARARSKCAVCPPFPYLGRFRRSCAGTPIAWGAQNVSEHAQGRVHRRSVGGDAGGIRLPLRDRRPFGAPRSSTARATRRWRRSSPPALARGLTPILCVGETLAEREAGRTRRGGRAPARTRCSTSVDVRRRGAGLRAGLGDRHRATRRPSRRRRCTRSCAARAVCRATRDSLRRQREGGATRRRCSPCRTSTAA